nr:MAG TPA: hypothetical protein [Caudoviricetes sp.]
MCSFSGKRKIMEFFCKNNLLFLIFYYAYFV